MSLHVKRGTVGGRYCHGRLPHIAGYVGVMMGSVCTHYVGAAGVVVVGIVVVGA